MLPGLSSRPEGPAADRGSASRLQSYAFFCYLVFRFSVFFDQSSLSNLITLKTLISLITLISLNTPIHNYKYKTYDLNDIRHAGELAPGTYIINGQKVTKQ